MPQGFIRRHDQGWPLHGLNDMGIVKVLPEPVTPKRVCLAKPDSKPSINEAIAVGWSPAG